MEVRDTPITVYFALPNQSGRASKSITFVNKNTYDALTRLAILLHDGFVISHIDTEETISRSFELPDRERLST